MQLPPPLQLQLPPEQSPKLHVAPGWHWIEQLPLEQSTVQVEPAAQAV